MKVSCEFCSSSTLKERYIERNKLAWSFPSKMPITPGHTLILPVRCVASFEDLTDGERTAIFKMVFRITHALKKAFGAQGFNFAWNQGALAGQSISHVHLHIVPRTEGDNGIVEYEPRKFLYRPGTRETTPEGELRSVSELIKSAL